MTSLQLEAWFPALAASIAGLIVVTVRYFALFLGLLVALSKSLQADRPIIFREFASTMRPECKARHAEICACSREIKRGLPCNVYPTRERPPRKRARIHPEHE
jgi:hypothetical protein